MHRVGILQMLGILDTLTSIYTCRECTRNMRSFLRFSWVHFREGLHLSTHIRGTRNISVAHVNVAEIAVVVPDPQKDKGTGYLKRSTSHRYSRRRVWWVPLYYACIMVVLGICEGESGVITGVWLTTQVFQDQVEFVVCLECIVETDNGRMLQKRERETRFERFTVKRK